MFDEVVKRLEALGWGVSPDDAWLITHLIEKVKWTIQNRCNIEGGPEGLRYVAVDMVCGEFLYDKKGSVGAGGLDVEAAVKSIKEGDTQVTYAVGDDSITYDGLINLLMKGFQDELLRYRRIEW
jgi:hypothetical protein